MKKDSDTIEHLAGVFSALVAIGIILFLLSQCGCLSYSHVRLNADGTRETTSFNSMLMKGDASKISSKVKDGPYSRDVSLGTVTGAGDVDMLKAVYQAGVSAGTKAAGVP